MKNNMDWEITCVDMCRGCMENNSQLVHIFEESHLYINSLAKKLAVVSGIEIQESDGLPVKLCANCIYRINAFYEFKELLLKTDKKLRELFQVPEDNVKKLYVEGINNQGITENDNQIEISNVETMDNDGNYQDADDIPEDEHIAMENTSKIMDDQFKTGHSKNTDSGENYMEEKNELCQSEWTPIETKYSHKLSLTEVTKSKLFGIKEHNYVKITVAEDSNVKQCLSKNKTVTKRKPRRSNKEVIPNVIYVDINNIKPTNIYTLEEKNHKSLKISAVVSSKKNEIENSHNKNNSEITHNNDNDNSDGEDSDFVEYGDVNVLGTLNDRVTKVKEVRVEGESTKYMCTLCSHTYDRLPKALLHMIDFHVPSTGPFYCITCEKDCTSSRELRNHVKVHDGKCPYSCYICEKAYKTRRYLKRHMLEHAEFLNFRCIKCGGRFKTKSKLEEHLKSHEGSIPFKCNQCHRVFNHKGNYKKHLITHIDPNGVSVLKFPCTVCGRRFSNRRTLNTHTRVHTGEKPYKCEYCDKCFSQDGNLRNHIKIHTNPRNFTCHECGKSFNQKSTLQDHTLLHSGEKPHVCTTCGLAFRFGSALRRHMWTHSGGKPFTCEVCGSQFLGRYDLKRHLKIHGDDRQKSKRNLTNRRKKTINNDTDNDIENDDEAIHQNIGLIEPNQIIIQNGNFHQIKVQQVFSNTGDKNSCYKDISNKFIEIIKVENADEENCEDTFD